MTNTQIRNIIRSKATDRDAKYRITKDGEVHFYGVMPNTNQIGWYFVGYDAAKVAAQIQTGEF